MKYVEAMIAPVRSGNSNLPRIAPLADAVVNLIDYLGGFEGEDDDREKPKLQVIIKLANTVNEQLERFGDQLDDHDCSTGDGQFIPVGSNEPLDDLLRRAGFISAEQVAIVDAEFFLAVRQ